MLIIRGFSQVNIGQWLESDGLVGFGNAKGLRYRSGRCIIVVTWLFSLNFSRTGPGDGHGIGKGRASREYRLRPGPLDNPQF